MDDRPDEVDPPASPPPAIGEILIATCAAIWPGCVFVRRMAASQHAKVALLAVHNLGAFGG